MADLEYGPRLRKNADHTKGKMSPETHHCLITKVNTLKAADFGVLQHAV